MTKKAMFDKLFDMYTEEMDSFFFFSDRAENEPKVKIYARYADKSFQKAQILEKAIKELFEIDAYDMYFKA